MGNVSLPHCSGVFTISLVIILHDVQTEAQDTTMAREGQEVSLSSTLRIMSNNNSGGKFAHRPCSTSGKDGPAFSGAMYELVRFLRGLLSETRLDTFPMPSFISRSSRTILLNDISIDHNILTPSNPTAQKIIQ